jgi:hypothetical protein
MADDGLIAPALTAATGTPSDMTLASMISRAEAAIDAYIGAPLLTNSGFAPGVLGLVQSGFDFSTRRFRFPLPLVPVRQIKRIQVHISNTGAGGTGLYADLLPSEVVLNEWEGYCELVALTLTYSMSAVVWELGLNPPILEVDLECGYYLPYLGDTLYDTGDHMNYRALRGFWATTYDQTLTAQPQTLPPIPAVIYNNGVAITNGFTLNATEGMVTFPTADATRVLTADYTAQLPDAVRDATIAQTSWLLAQRTLTQMGMLGVDDIKSGETMVRRHQMMSGGTKVQAPLCEEALAKLSAYKIPAIA